MPKNHISKRNYSIWKAEGESCNYSGPQLMALGQISPIFIGKISLRAMR
jgi:hypothetical protein